VEPGGAVDVGVVIWDAGPDVACVASGGAPDVAVPAAGCAGVRASHVSVVPEPCAAAVPLDDAWLRAASLVSSLPRAWP
jgi:hypothetical protein